MGMCQWKRLCNLEPLAQPVKAEHANSPNRDLGPTMMGAKTFFFKDISVSAGILLGDIHRSFENIKICQD